MGGAHSEPAGVGADARRNESQIFREVAQREDAVELMKSAQARYNAGADSYDALRLEK